MNPFDRLLVSSLPWVPRPLVRRFSAPYVAGERTEDAFRVVGALNREGFVATLDILGEDVTETAQTEAAAGAYLSLLDAIARERLDSNVSLKLSQFGLKLDRKLCRQHLRAIVERAAGHSNFVRIDMEDSSTTDATLELYRDLRQEFSNLGVVLQACLKRTVADARALAAIGASVRVCKGIYIEPAEIAWRDRERVRASYLETVETLLQGCSYVGIATHDEVLVAACESLVRRMGLEKRGRYEFQMLLGVREGLRDAVLAGGHRLRVYVPYGDQWYAYSLRRLRENPAIARYVVKALFTGDGWKRAR